MSTSAKRKEEHHELADITGVTGTAIVEAILKGQRDPRVLASYHDQRVKATEQTLMAALTGDYRREHLFCLKQSSSQRGAFPAQVCGVDVKLLPRIP